MKVIKYLTVFSLFLFISVSIVACGDDDSNNNGKTLNGPAGVMSLMSAWGTTSTDEPALRDNMSAASFKHDDHDEKGLTCTSCHATNAGEPIVITDIDNDGKLKLEIHEFCAKKCHVNLQDKKDAPQPSDCYECHKVTAKVNLKDSWGLAAGSKEPVTFKHGDHDDDKILCANCHTPANDGTLNIITPNDKTTAHNFCDSCHIRDNDAPNTSTNCTECHKAVSAGGMPDRDINLKRSWNPASISKAVPAKFEHKEHNQTCITCHAAADGGKIDISATAGNSIQEKAHTLCGNCHVNNRKAPQVNNAKDCEDCHDD